MHTSSLLIQAAGRLFGLALLGLGLIAAPPSAQAAYQPGSLVAYWPLEEGDNGATSADLSGNGNTVEVKETIVIDPPTWVPAGGQFGGALEFDGVENFCFFNATSLFDIGTSGTVSFWVYPHDLGRRNQLFEGPGNAGMEIQYRTNGGGQFYGSPNRVGGSSYSIEGGGSAALQNSWVCLQLTWGIYDGSPGTMRIYKNGSEVASYALGPGVAGWTPGNELDTTSGVFYVGRDPGDPSRYFDGLIDDMAFYNTVLSPTDLATIRTSGASAMTTNQVAHWTFDQVSGTTAFDASGNGHDLTLFSSSTPSPAPELVSNEKPPIADSAGSLNFTGGGYRSIIQPSASLNWDKTEGTILFWYKPQISNARQALIHGLNPGGSKTLEVQVSGSSGSLWYRPFLNLQPSANSIYPLDLSLQTPGPGDVNVNQWHHLGWSWDMSRTPGTQTQPNRIRGFLNGAYADCYIGTSGTNPDANWNTAPVTDLWALGYYAPDSRDLDGNLAEIALFNVGLSDADIAYIYQYGVDAFVNAPNLAGVALADSDTTDNCNPSSFTNNLVIDVTPQGVTGTSSAILVSEDNFATSTSIPFAATVQYTLNSAAEGDRTIYVQLGDTAGNPAGDIVSSVISYDATAPAGSAVTSPSGAVSDVAGIMDVAFTAATDGGAQPSGSAGVKLWYRKDSGSWTVYNSGAVFAASPIAFDIGTTGGGGTYEVYCVGVDCAGNEEGKAQAAEQTFTVTPTRVRDWTTHE